MTTGIARAAPETIYATMAEPAELLVEPSPERVSVSVHDASRLAWNVVVPLPETGSATYSFELDLEAPSNLLGALDPWAALQSYARLAGGSDLGIRPKRSADTFRRDVVEVCARLVRARDGFVRHCTLIRSSAEVEDNHSRALLLWLDAAAMELSHARERLLSSSSGHEAAAERALADEFLSLEAWAGLTDCARALFDTRRALAARANGGEPLDHVARALAAALESEIGYRKRAEFPLAEPVNALQLARLVSRMRLLKKHFERVLFLDSERYEVVHRFAGWFSAITAMLAYLWFVFWQVTFERHRTAVGSGIVAIALVTAIAYASRERLKDAARNWLAGRAQRMFAQRIARYRLASTERHRGPLVVSARESFSRSIAQRPDPVPADCAVMHDVTLLRFVHRARVVRPPTLERKFAREIRFAYRLDLSCVFPRLHDAVRGFATPGHDGDPIVIVDVPRNYELPVRAKLRVEGGLEEVERVLVLNKNGLLRVEDK